MYRLPPFYHDGPERRPCTPGRGARRAALVALLAAALGGCDDPAGSPGPLVARLVSPRGPEGAALFDLPVDGVSDVRAVEGELFEVVQGGRRRVAVFMDAPGPIVLRLVVDDQTRPPEVTIVQVSDPLDRPRALTGYRVAFEAPLP